MEIAPSVQASDWVALDFQDPADRLKGVEFFRKRIDARFLEPTRKLLPMYWIGFAVMALDSLLVETLEQFTRGVEETPRRKATEYFRASLKRAAFRGEFDDTKADLFRSTIRNGILHQAATRGTSLVRRIGPMVQLTASNDGLIINRNEFHKCIETAVTDYTADVSAPNSNSWAQFRAKMEFIAGKNPSP